MAANLIKKAPSWFRLWILKRMGIWPPFWGAGIKIDSISADFLNIQSSLKMGWFNRNYVNTHFGGSIYAMTDPFYMLMLLNVLGPEYVVWDLAANIRFKIPGRGRLTAKFSLEKQEIEEIKRAADSNPKHIWKKTIEVRDLSDNVVAEVEKVLYIKRK